MINPQRYPTLCLIWATGGIVVVVGTILAVITTSNYQLLCIVPFWSALGHLISLILVFWEMYRR